MIETNMDALLALMPEPFKSRAAAEAKKLSALSDENRKATEEMIDSVRRQHGWRAAIMARSIVAMSQFRVRACFIGIGGGLNDMASNAIDSSMASMVRDATATMLYLIQHQDLGRNTEPGPASPSEEVIALKRWCDSFENRVLSDAKALTEAGEPLARIVAEYMTSRDGGSN